MNIIPAEQFVRSCYLHTSLDFLNYPGDVANKHLRNFYAYITGNHNQGPLNFVRWHLVFMGHRMERILYHISDF
jgi:hypothetical protein